MAILPYQIDLCWTREPRLRPFRLDGIRRPLFQVDEELLYTVTVAGKQLQIPVEAGFVTDGASIPLGLRWLIPQTQSTWAPALFHDLAYGAQGWHRFTRAQCDALFGVGLTKQSIPARRIIAMYGAVAHLGHTGWHDNNPIDQYNRLHGHLASPFT